MQVESIADALAMYKKHLEVGESIDKAKQTYDLTLTALTRYTLPGWGHPAPNGRKPTRVEKENAQTFLANASIKKLEEAEEIQEKTFKMLNATDEQQYAYRSRLTKFLEWVQKQGLLKDESQSVKNINGNFYHSHGNGGKKRTTKRKRLPPYRLNPKDASPQLLAEIEEFKEFLLAEYYPNRKSSPLKNENSANQSRDWIYRILGWFQKERKVTGDLTLNLLVPEPKHKRNKNRSKSLIEAEETATYIETWICEFIKFLETKRKNKSSSILDMFKTIHQIIRYKYLGETRSNNYTDIPAMLMIRNYMSDFKKKVNLQKVNLRQESWQKDLKWLDLPDVITEIVLALRNETNFRSKGHVLRSITVIASSFQDFVVWGLFTFRAPRRQQEWRQMKIGLSCSLNDKPKDLAPNAFIHPLQRDNRQTLEPDTDLTIPFDEKPELKHGYLYKSIDGKWYKDTPSESYKTGDAYGPRPVLIPNPMFPDGKCFYDYLEAYLYGYYRDKKGNWLSGGQVTDSDLVNKSGQLYSLRMAFNPEHNYVFLGSTKAQPLSQTGFGKMFSSIANRLTGKMLNPHLMRDIYATWFLDQGYSEDVIASLAYEMGHSQEMLRKNYDRRKSEQRSRPCDEATAKIMDELINYHYSSPVGSPTPTPKKSDSPPDLAKIISILTPEQKRQLGI